ncbi:hypothetical protein [Psychromonas sp. SP041]|uniref:hypothetical protein n=1 Tax=Psychromonas sp. SP041 TaxID=1365007 RepID=UPI0004072F45|nr:hypothetical protein [Psychromonas sp. SP041]
MNKVLLILCFLTPFSWGNTVEENYPSINILAQKGDFSTGIIDFAEKILKVNIKVTFESNENEMHDRLLKSDGYGYDIIYESGINLKNLEWQGWIDSVPEMLKDGRIKVWKAGLYGIMKRTSMPNISWAQAFMLCEGLKGRIKITNNGLVNTVLASGKYEPTESDMVKVRDNVFNTCRFRLPSSSKSKDIRNLYNNKIIYSLTDNEEAKKSSSLHKEFRFYIPKGKRYGWSKNWVILGHSRDVELCRSFIAFMSSARVLRFESTLKYSSIPGLIYEKNDLLGISNSYRPEMQIQPVNLTDRVLIRKIQAKIIGNSIDN